MRVGELTRDMERVLRRLDMQQGGGGPGGPLDPLLAATREVVELYNASASYQQALSPTMPHTLPAPYVQDIWPTLHLWANNTLNRRQAVVQHLHQQLSGEITERLKQCGWPPPLTASPPEEEECFLPEHAELINELQMLMVALTALQQVDQYDAFRKMEEEDLGASTHEGPILWVAKVAAHSFTEALTQHFTDPQLPTSDVHQPQWMFDATLKVIREHAGKLEVFQGVIDSRELHSTYHLSIEFARALRDTLVDILVNVRFPALLDLPEEDQLQLWVAYFEQMVKFEYKLAPLIGVFLEDGDPLPPVVVRQACTKSITDRKEFLAAWITAERNLALKNTDEILYDAGGWAPVRALLDEPTSPGPRRSRHKGRDAEDGDDLHTGGPASAADQEFYPPVAAQGLEELLGLVMSRARCLGDFKAVERFLRSVVSGVIQTAHDVMDRKWLSYKNDPKKLLGEARGQLCSTICAAHYLEKALEDMSEEVVVIRGLLEGAQGPKDKGAAEGIFDQQVRLVMTDRREWSLRLAHAVGLRIKELLKAYLHSLDRLAASSMGIEDVDGVSPSLTCLVEYLGDSLAELSHCLDAVCFREVWKAAATILNGEIFNEVALEAQFSSFGVRQFSVDCKAVLALFQPYSSRPQAHFKELSEALLLLQLEDEAHGQLFKLLNHSSNVVDTRRELQAVGVNTLTGHQAAAVLGRKLWD